MEKTHVWEIPHEEDENRIVEETAETQENVVPSPAGDSPSERVVSVPSLFFMFNLQLFNYRFLLFCLLRFLCFASFCFDMFCFFLFLFFFGGRISTNACWKKIRLLGFF